MTSPDLEMLAREGDPSAFAELIREWDHDLRGMVWSVVRSAHATDDVMQTAYSEAFTSIDRFDGQAPMKTWLHTICLRAAIDRSRRDGDDDRPDRVTASSPDSVELAEAFDSLDGVERLLVMLTAGLGYEFVDTATIVGMSKDTVASTVGRARDRLSSRTRTVDPGEGNGEPELHGFLDAQIPPPGDGYWESIEARLRVAEAVEPNGRGAAPVAAVERDGDAGSDAPVAETSTESAGKARTSRRNVLIAAAALVVAGLGLFALLNRNGDDPAALETTNQSASDTTNASTTVTPAPSNSDGAPDENVAQAEPATAEDLAELNAAMDASPLGAVVLRLSEGSDSPAGPYCFSHPNSYVFPADELDDRRALLQLDVALDGFVSFTAMQGETIVLTGSGYPDETGLLTTTPIAAVGASGAPPYEVRIGDDQISVSASEPPLALVDCNDPGIASRSDTMFTLLADPTANWVFDAWPPDDAVLSSAGLGPIRIGMTVSELEAELRIDLSIETIDGNVAGACGSVAATTAIARDVWILVELTGPDDAIIRRVSTFSGPWFTPSGITVGSSQQDVIETFPGQIEERPHVYTDGTYMRFLPTNADDPNTVEFVNEGGTIAEIRAGDRDWVGLVEGCA